MEKNLMVEEAYEPGSTIKILTMSVAYDRQPINQVNSINQAPSKLHTMVKDYNKVGWGQDYFWRRLLARSSNVAASIWLTAWGTKNGQKLVTLASARNWLRSWKWNNR